MQRIEGHEAMRRELAEDCAHLHVLQARIGKRLVAIDEAGAWGGSGIRSIEHWASMALGLAPSQTAALLRVSRKLAVLPELDAAVLDGRLSMDKARAIAPVATPATQARWLDLAERATVTQVQRIVAAWRRVSADGSADEPPDGHPGRRLWWSARSDGLEQLTALLTPEDAALVKAALANAIEQQWRETPADDRTAQPAAGRAADALVALAETAMAAGPKPLDGGERNAVHLVVEADVLAGIVAAGVCHLEGDRASLPLAEARMLACDATIRPLLVRDGIPIDVGRAKRLVTRSQRRALKARDGGCTFPGCGHTRFLDAHHVDHWVDGGRTDLGNLVLLCRSHHRLHHRGEFLIEATARAGAFAFVDRHGRIIGRPPHPPPRVEPGALAARTELTPTWLTPHAKQCAEIHMPSIIDGLLDAHHARTSRWAAN